MEKTHSRVIVTANIFYMFIRVEIQCYPHIFITMLWNWSKKPEKYSYVLHSRMWNRNEILRPRSHGEQLRWNSKPPSLNSGSDP